MKKILFLDFEDSFTFNVIQEMNQQGMSCEVLHWSEFTQPLSPDLLVLGPGPGHPDDYLPIYGELKAHLECGRKIFGVCLGHQILWRMRGAEVSRSVNPLHGQKIKLDLDQSWRSWLEVKGEVWVQRYNSLAVKGPVTLGENFLVDGEVLMSQDGQCISYQFHPESVGTNCRSVFFRTVRRVLL